MAAQIDSLRAEVASLRAAAPADTTAVDSLADTTAAGAALPRPGAVPPPAPAGGTTAPATSTAPANRTTTP